MKNRPIISVIVPIYGVEKYLKQCLDSILEQTLKNIEIILVDDGGKDACPQICDDYAKKDNRIKVFHKKNGGYGQSCNVGLDNASGEYVAIVEPDDFIDSKMYEDLYKIAKDNNSDIVKSCYYDNLQSPQKTRIKKVNWEKSIPQNKSFTIKECPHFLHRHPCIWSCIYKREFIEKHHIRFIEAPGSGWTDNPFQVQTMCLAERINYTSTAYYYWRRLNYFESDALYDYTLPFKRSDEIHEWLEKNNINDENILACLYIREIIYIYIVLGMKKIGNKSDCYKRIKEMCQRMDANIVLNNPFVINKEKKHFLQYQKNLSILRFKILFKRYKKNFKNFFKLKKH